MSKWYPEIDAHLSPSQKPDIIIKVGEHVLVICKLYPDTGMLEHGEKKYIPAAALTPTIDRLEKYKKMQNDLVTAGVWDANYPKPCRIKEAIEGVHQSLADLKALAGTEGK